MNTETKDKKERIAPERTIAKIRYNPSESVRALSCDGTAIYGLIRWVKYINLIISNQKSNN